MGYVFNTLLGTQINRRQNKAEFVCRNKKRYGRHTVPEVQCEKTRERGYKLASAGEPATEIRIIEAAVETRKCIVIGSQSCDIYCRENKCHILSCIFIFNLEKKNKEVMMIVSNLTF